MASAVEDRLKDFRPKVANGTDRPASLYNVLENGDLLETEQVDDGERGEGRSQENGGEGCA
jgi:hypothetical protein